MMIFRMPCDEPVLGTLTDCHREITVCSVEIGKIQEEYEQWMAANPRGNWPGAGVLISQWQKRKDKAEERFAVLRSR